MTPRRWILDLGMHAGKDTEFYLRKGFDVVAVEANPALVAGVRTRLARYVEAGRLAIHAVAIAEREGAVEFYVNDTHDTWGTASPRFAARNRRLGTGHTAIRVPGTTLARILGDGPGPYYLKIDVEGADTLCLRQLLPLAVRPPYLSVEVALTSFEEGFEQLALLWQLGYRAFQIVNQALLPRVRCPTPPREGAYVDARFDSQCSGLFGEELPGRWMGIEETLRGYRRVLIEQRWFGAGGRLYRTPAHRLYEALRQKPAGWYDVHARRGVHAACAATAGDTVARQD